MTQPSIEPASAMPGDVVVASAPAPDYEALRREYEEFERMSAMLQQMAEWQFRVEYFSAKYFPSGVTFTLEPDPEIAEAYFVVNAKASGTIEELVKLQNNWHHELWEQLQQASHFFRLRLEPK